MRVSTNKKDAGWNNYDPIFGYHVKLNGKEMADVITADDDLGCITTTKRPFEMVGAEFVTEELYGEVEITKVKLQGGEQHELA
jgi:hypothetical protein